MNCATEYNPGLKKGVDSITLVMEGATIHGRWALSQVRSKYFILCYYISAPEQGETPLKSSEPQAPPRDGCAAKQRGTWAPCQ
jgi:hypothetical protein